MNLDFTRSRGFWVAISATVVAALTLMGVDNTSIALVTGALAAWSAFFVVAAVRGRGTRSRAQVMRLLEEQAVEVRALELANRALRNGRDT